MSLLMEALKKAEEAKRLAAESSTSKRATTAADLTLAPLSAPAQSPLPDLSLHIDSVDADLAAVSTASPHARATPHSATTTASTEPDDTTAREAARNMFTAKQATTGGGSSNSSLPLILGVGGIAMFALGAYFWWQLQALSSNALAPATNNVAADARRTNTPPALTAPSTLANTSTSEAAAIAERPPTPPVPIATPAHQTATSLFGDARPAPAKKARLPASAPPLAPEGLVRITRSPPKPNQTIETAYDALLAGQFELAQRNYELVLRRDAKNVDALLGLATIASSRGETDRAYQYYLGALESNPTNAVAQAGLVAIGGQSDPEHTESRLKTALAAQPDAAALHFALGNLYAQQARWGEAQQAYFNAYSIEPDNADFIFNQAVSLDHLHKNALAGQYYRMALAAADRNGMPRPVAFDRQQVRTRLQELQP